MDTAKTLSVSAEDGSPLQPVYAIQTEDDDMAVTSTGTAEVLGKDGKVLRLSSQEQPADTSAMGADMPSMDQGFREFSNH
jgi:hypothetical protein